MLNPDHRLVLIARQAHFRYACQVLHLLLVRAPLTVPVPVNVVHVDQLPHIKEIDLRTRGWRQSVSGTTCDIAWRGTARTLLRWETSSMTLSFVDASLRWKADFDSQLPRPQHQRRPHQPHGTRTLAPAGETAYGVPLCPYPRTLPLKPLR